MKCFSVLSIFGAISLASAVYADDHNANPADKKIQVAFAQCEQGLLLPSPKSAVGLKVLQRHFKKYEAYRNAATTLNPQIVKTDTVYKSKYPQLGDKPYKTLYEQCQTELVAKIAQAQEQVDKQSQYFQGVTYQQAESIKKLTDSVMPNVKSAMELCKHYVQTPLPKDAPEKTRNQFNADMATYQNTKKQIIKTHPGILQVRYKTLKRDNEANTVAELEDVLLHWFDYCDSMFSGAQSHEVDPEGPPLPDAHHNAPKDKDSKEKDGDESPPADSAEDAAAAEAASAAALEDAIKNAKGDRKKALEQEKHLADITDKDDDPNNAKTWLFDSTGKDGSECHTYIFDKDHKMTSQKNTKGLCEPPK
jgi:hypothetical protein